MIWLLLLFELVISTSGIELHRFSRVVGSPYAELVYEVFARIGKGQHFQIFRVRSGAHFVFRLAREPFVIHMCLQFRYAQFCIRFRTTIIVFHYVHLI